MSGPQQSRGKPTSEGARAPAGRGATPTTTGSARPGSARAVVEAARGQITALRQQLAQETSVREAAERVVQHLQGLLTQRDQELAAALTQPVSAAAVGQLQLAEARARELEVELLEARARVVAAEAERDAAAWELAHGRNEAPEGDGARPERSGA
ncbi:MAG: hypothetical protein CVU56_05045, partial [Deltaproteobacteria bacterium HGW-Deltaproteobacteria-14]